MDIDFRDILSVEDIREYSLKVLQVSLVITDLKSKYELDDAKFLALITSFLDSIVFSIGCQCCLDISEDGLKLFHEAVLDAAKPEGRVLGESYEIKLNNEGKVQFEGNVEKGRSTRLH